MRIIDITGTEYHTPDRTMLRLDFKIGILRFSLHLDAHQRIAMSKVLAGSGDAYLPIDDGEIFVMVPKGTRILTCETLNVRKG